MSGSTASALDKTQIQKARMLFNIIDADGDEKINLQDLRKCFEDVGMESIGEEEIRKMIKNDDGINFNEFLNIFEDKFQGFSEESELKDAFETFKDENNNNKIDSNLLSKKIQEVAETEESKTMVNQIVKDFTKENKVSGAKHFESDKFIDQIKN